jgi:tetratricopeptide (TPR) repeat protein
VDGSAAEAAPLYTRAIVLYERLIESDQDNRQYKLELAKFSDNLAVLLLDQGQPEAAVVHSRRAVDLIEELARVSPSLAIERADAHNVRAWLLESQDPAAAEREYAEALELFVDARDDGRSYRLPDFHLRFGDLLVNLAGFPDRASDPDNARRLLTRAVASYAQIARTIVDSGSLPEVEHALATVNRVLPELPDSEKRELTAVSQQLQSAVNDRRGN